MGIAIDKWNLSKKIACSMLEAETEQSITGDGFFRREKDGTCKGFTGDI